MTTSAPGRSDGARGGAEGSSDPVVVRDDPEAPEGSDDAPGVEDWEASGLSSPPLDHDPTRIATAATAIDAAATATGTR
jgi:hypothetical protein